MSGLNKNRISAIVAMSRNNVIGRNNQLPWHLPADLRYFKKTTLGKTILMGRKTFASIGKPLVGRRNIIISRDTNFKVEGAEVFSSIEKALESLKEGEEILIIGGAEIYKQTLPFIQRLYLTMVDAEFDGDVFFPKLNMSEWKEISCEAFEPDSENIYPFKFLVLDRNF